MSVRKPTRHRQAQQAGFRALHLCTGLFTSELDDEQVYGLLQTDRAPSVQDVVDEQARIVSVAYKPDMPARLAVSRPYLGSVQLPIGATTDATERLARLSDTSRPPDLDNARWPLGDVDAVRPILGERGDSLERLFDAAFERGGRYKSRKTWGLAVLKDGKIVGERYADGFGVHTAVRTNSMCKSLSSTVVGVGVHHGLLDIDATAVLEEWTGLGDPRKAITVNHLLQMASGLYTEAAGYPQMELYGSGAPVAELSTFNMVTAQPGTRFVYSGSDTVLALRALKQASGLGQDFIAFPYAELLWKIGMTRTVIETDWNSDFLGSGQSWSTVRDYARLALLYLNGGKWGDEQLIPSDWADYVSTPAPAQPRNPELAGYGAHFWLYGTDRGLPTPGYAAAGAFGNFAMIVPEANIVVVRRGLDYRDADVFDIAAFTADVIELLA